MVTGLTGMLLGIDPDPVQFVIALRKRELKSRDAGLLFFREGGAGFDPGIEGTRLFVEGFEFALGFGERVLELAREIALLAQLGGEIVHLGAAIADNGLQFLHLGERRLVFV